MQLPPLGMADDHVACAGIFQHLCADIACEGAGGLGAAILTADRNTSGCLRHGAVDEGCRGANQNLGSGRRSTDLCRNCLDLSERRAEAIHFPISRHQRTHACKPVFSWATLTLPAPKAIPIIRGLSPSPSDITHASANAPASQMGRFPSF